MVTKEDIDALVNSLEEKVGDVKKNFIQQSGVSPPTVKKFLSHEPMKPDKKLAIYDAGLELLDKYEQDRIKRARRTQRLVTGRNSQVQLDLKS